MTALAVIPAEAQNAAWNTDPTVAGPTPGTFDFNANANWTPATVPTGTAFFEATNGPNISFSASTTTIGTWSFDASLNDNAQAYNFTNNQILVFSGGAGLEFFASSSAAITNNLLLQFNNGSAGTNTTITNNATLNFSANSNAGSAIITTISGATTGFFNTASGGTAQLINDAGGIVDISSLTSGGTTAGSIEGAGTFRLGSKSFQVGSNDLSTIVSGAIQDGGFGGGTGGSLIKVGGGVLTLTGTNTYSGGTSFNGGTISVSNESTLGATSGALTFNGGTLQVTGTTFTSITRALTWNGGGLDIVDAGNTFTVNQVLGSGNLIKSGEGTLRLTAVNTYGGGTIIAGGVVEVGNGSLGTGNVSLLGSTFLAVADGMNFGVAFGLGGIATFDTNGNGLTISGNITDDGIGSLRKIGAGTLTLSGTNSYSGATTIETGTLVAASAGALPTFSAVAVNNGATLSVTNNVSTGSLADGTAGGGTVTIANTRTLTVGSNGGFTTFSGTITGGGALQLIGNTLLTLSGNNNYSGGTTISAGFTIGPDFDPVPFHAVLEVTNNSSVGSGIVTLDGGTFQAGANGLNFINAFNVNATGGTVNTNSNTLTISSAIADGSGAGVLTKTGAGTLVLTGDNSSFTGGVTINGGTISVGHNNSLGTGTFTVQGSTLDIQNGITISNTTELQANLTINVDAPGTPGQVGTHAGVIGPNLTPFGIEKTGAGTLVLTGDNLYSGGTTITAGTLQVGNGVGGGSLGFGNVVNNSLLVINKAGNLNIFGEISGTGSLQHIGTGTTTLGSSTYSGTTLVSAGTLEASAVNALSANSAFTVNAPGTVDIRGGNQAIGSLAGDGTVTNSSENTRTLTVGGDNTSTVFAGVITQGNLAVTALNKVGTGTLTLSGTNTFTGGTTVNAGTLTLVNGAALVDSGAVTMLGGTLNVTFTETIGSLAGTGGTVTVALNETLTTGGNNAATSFDGVFAGAGSVTFTGTGTKTLTGTGSSIGGALTQASTGTLTLDGGSLAVGGATQIFTGTFNVTNGATLNNNNLGIIGIGANATAVVTGAGSTWTARGGFQLGVFGGTGTLTVANGGALIATNSTVEVNAGSTLNIGNGGIAGTVDAQQITLNGPNAQVIANFTDTMTLGAAIVDGGPVNAGSLTKQGAGTLILTGDSGYAGGTTISGGTLQLGDGGNSGSIGGNIANNAILAINRALGTTLNLDGDITGIGSLLQNGPGTTILNGTNNTYAGGTTINAGVLLVSNNTAAGGGAITMNGGTFGPGADNLNVANNFTINAGGGTITTEPTINDAFTLTLSGMISGGGTLIKVGAGTLVLTNANTYSGGTNINAGTLDVRNGNALVDAGAVTIADVAGANLLVTSSEIIGALAGGGTAGGTVQIAVGQTLTTGGNNASTAFAGIISGDGGLVKTGTGNFTLSGNNTYTGTTGVEAGTLFVNGSLASSAVTVNNGATLGGTGAIANAVSIANGATLAPGNSAGTITVGSLNLNSSSILAYELGTPNVVGGGTNDLTNVTGNLVLDGTLNVTDLGGFGLGAYRIVNYGGPLTDNGLAIGTLPGAFSGSIQTAIPGQVNLIVSGPGVLMQFWDGPDSVGNGVVNGGTGTWNNANTNWTSSNGAINSSWQGGFGVFAGTAGVVSVNAAVAYQGLQFSTDGYVVNAIGGGQLTPTGTAQIRVDDGVTATIAAPIDGAGGLNKTDPGRLILTGANSYTGGTTISAGTLQLGNGGASGTIQGGAGNVTVNGTAVFAINRSDTFTYSGLISGSGSFAQLGIGTIVLSNSNTYQGGTLISAGTLRVMNASAVGTGLVTLNGGTFQAGLPSLSFNNTFTINAAGGTVDSGFGTLTLSGAIDGTGAFTKVGAGTLVLSGNNTYTGTTTISQGTLEAQNGNAIGDSSAVTMANVAGARLLVTNSETIGSLAGGGTTGGTVEIAAGQTLTTGGNDTSTAFAGVISGSGGLTKTGSGIFTLTGINTYSGNTLINAGTLEVRNGSALADTGAVTITNAAGANLLVTNSETIGSLAGGGATGGAVQIAAGQALTTGADNTSTAFAGVISGSGGLTKTGSGIFTLTGINTYSGNTLINAGTLEVRNGSALADTGAVTIANAAGANLLVTNSETIGSLAGGGTTGGTVEIAAEQTLTTGGNGATTTFAGVISGSGGLTKTGSGIFTLTGINTYSSNTTINAGTLEVRNGSALADTGAVTIANAAGANLLVTNSEIIGSLAGGGTTGGAVQIASGQALTTGADNTSTTFAGVISGSGGLIKTGAGALTLEGDNTYAGGTILNAGTLILANNNALGTGALTTLGSVVSYNNGISITNPIVLNSNTTQLEVLIGTATQAGVISEAGGARPLEKIGGGTLILTAANTYSGPTTVTGGTLQLGNDTTAGSIRGAVNVAIAARLNVVNSDTSLLTTVTNTDGEVNFSRTSTAGGATYNNRGGGSINFTDTSNAGTATFNNTDNGFINFNNNSSADRARIFNTVNSVTFFNDGSTAADAVISNASSGSNLAFTQFRGTSTAARATITSGDGGALAFTGTSTAANATIVNNGTNASTAAFTQFDGNATAGSAKITNNDGLTLFANNSSAGNAQIVNFGTPAIFGATAFFNSSTAGNASITNDASGLTQFSQTSTAGNSAITTNASGFTVFTGSSTAASATVTTNNGGQTRFNQTSTGGNARLITNAGGVLDISRLTSAGMTAGSIEGAGNIFLGSKLLTVGGNDRSTEVSGVIADGGGAPVPGTGGSLTKVGTGALTLSGINTYTGATTIDAGALIVTGSIANSAVTVNSGGTLGGNGTVGPLTINGGTLSPGTSIGTITIQGSLVLSSAAAYIVEVNPTAADRTNVTTAATLAGNLALQVASGAYTPNRQYVLLHADGGRTGTFTTGDISGAFGPTIRARIDYTANDVILNLAPSSATIFLPAGASQNVRNVAGALDQIFLTNNPPPELLALVNRTPDGLSNALSQLAGQHATGAAPASNLSMHLFLNAMLDPFVSGRSGGFGAALGYAPEETHPAAAAFAAALPVKAPPRESTFDQRWTVWGAAYGGKSRTDGDAIVGSNDLSANAAGFAAGADYRVTPGTVIGAATAIGETGWTVAGLGKGNADAAKLGAYFSTRSNNFYLSGAVAGAWYRAVTDRTLNIAGTDRLEADFDAQQVGMRVETGYRFGMPSFSGPGFGMLNAGVTPYAAFQMESMRTPGYSERATAGSNQFALSYAPQTTTDSRSELGLWFDVHRLFANGTQLTLRSRAAWVHDFDPGSRVQAAFQTLPGASFTVDGAAAPRNSVLTSAAAELRLRNGVSLIGKFDGEFSSRSRSVAGTGTLRYAW